MAFYSTPSDLVRFALATNPGSVNGELAGGMVMSLMMGRDSGIVVAVTSNMAHANTSSLAMRVGDAFAEPAAVAPVEASFARTRRRRANAAKARSEPDALAVSGL
jgi:hypothetical protein